MISSGHNNGVVFLRALALAAMLMLTGGPAAAVQGEGASLNLRDVDIRALIDTIAEVTGKNFLVDPRVKGEVTVVSSKTMTPEEIYQVFLSILEVHGFTAVPAGKVIKIVPDASVRMGTMTDESEQAAADIPGDEMVTRVIEVKHVDAARLVPVLRPLMPQQAQLGAYPAANTLVISDRAANVERIAEIIARIDRVSDVGVEVIRLKHAQADQLVKTITEFYNEPKSNEGGAGVILAVDPRSNSILLSADPERRLRIRSLIAHLDTPMEVEGETQIVFLRNTDAEQIAVVLQHLAEISQTADGKGKGDKLAKRIDIQAHEANNALVLTAPPEEMRNLKAVIRQLDIQRAQILVEAVIAEVSTDLNKELGAQFFVANLNGDSAPLAYSNFGEDRLSTFAGAIQSGRVPSFGSGAFLGFGRLGVNGTNWGVIINALSGDAATNILSTPTLLATDNEEAEIVVGQNVPFVTGQFTNTTSSGAANAVNPFQTIERRDIGITLRVKPQINEGDRVRMVIEQEVSSLASTSVSTSDVVTNKRAIKTTATVRDGQIIVLGGLIEDRFTDSEQKVPLLGDVPLLGGLFRYESTRKVKQNLMVFLRPAIVSDPALGRSFAGEKYGYLRDRQQESRLRERGLLDLKGGAPELPVDLQGLFDGRGDIPPPPPPPATAPEPAPEDDRPETSAVNPASY